MVPYEAYGPEGSPEEEAAAFAARMALRRTVRAFSEAPVSETTIRSIVAAAASSPSGANKLPWRFVCVRDPALKRAIREGAEAEERLFYDERASERWLQDLQPFGTDAHKPFLETAPWLIVVFKLTRGDKGDQVYYVHESVGIATGFLLAAVHHAGLVALTHTPSPMGFLCELLGRPDNEKPFLLIPIGHPAEGCLVPEIERKGLEEVLVIDRG